MTGKRCALIVAVILAIGGGAVASGETPRVEIHYDAIGNRVGRTVQHGDQKVHYDRMGRRTGTSVQKISREIHRAGFLNPGQLDLNQAELHLKIRVSVQHPGASTFHEKNPFVLDEIRQVWKVGIHPRHLAPIKWTVCSERVVSILQNGWTV